MKIIVIMMTLAGILSLRLYGQFPVDTSAITIVRDIYGVPHIYAATDAGAAYGLAWAHAEDDFKSIQENLIAARGKLGLIQGKDGALLDLFMAFMGTDSLVEKKYETDLSPGFKKMLGFYVTALNRYAELHPEEILLKSVLPFTEKDVIKGYCIAFDLFSGAILPVADVFRNKPGEVEKLLPSGSNAFAMNGNFSTDGNTYLLANPHNTYEGRFAWYEAHVVSEEGLNFSGALFAGGVTPFLGYNENIAWSHTFNYHDLVDVLKLTVDKKGKHYRLDGQWLPLEKKTAISKVKVGPLKVKVKIPYYETVYGPALKNKSGYYAISVATNTTIHAAEQWYEMCKSTDFETFTEAWKMDGFPLLNMVYADKAGNIMFASQAHFPKRKIRFPDHAILPGDTSLTLWDGIVPFENRPQLINPGCGYLFNANNTPFNSTCEEDDLRPEDYGEVIGIQQVETNRSYRLNELFATRTNMSFAELVALKFDRNYPQGGYVMEGKKRLLHIDTLDYPEITPIFRILNAWTGNADTGDIAAKMFVLHANNIATYMDMDLAYFMIGAAQPSEAQLRKSMLAIQDFYLKYYGRLEVPLGEIQRHIRGDKDFPIGGITETLAPTESSLSKNGRFRAYSGDSFIQYIKFTANGPEVKSVHAYGASSHPGSAHYNDQMELYLQGGSKPSWFWKADVYGHAEKIYHPQ